MPESLEQKTAEFEQHLWDHTTDPFQMAFDRRAPFTGEEAAFLSDIVAMICERQNDTAMSNFIRERVRAESELIHPVLQVAGLTRNKMLVDLKAGTRGGDVRISGRCQAAPGERRGVGSDKPLPPPAFACRLAASVQRQPVRLEPRVAQPSHMAGMDTARARKAART